MNKRSTSTAALRAPSSPADSRLVTWLIGAMIAIAVVLVFFPVCDHSFVVYDDYENIARDVRMNPPTFENIVAFWKAPYLYLYVPLTYTAWTLLAMSARRVAPDSMGLRIDAGPFHTFNLFLHVMTAVVVYRLLLRLVKRPWAAAMGALLFALHPLQVEPVAWATGTKDVLSGLLALIALWQYIAFAQQSFEPTPDVHAPPHRRLHYAVATIAFVLALLSKPSAVVVPLMAVVIDLVLLRRKLMQALISTGPWFALAAACALFTRHVQPVRATTIAAGPLWARPLLATDAIAFYLYKIVWPLHLMPQYDHTPQAAIERGWIYWAWIAPAIVATLAILFRKRFAAGAAALALLVAGTLPVLGLAPFQFEEISLVADRYVYLAMIGPAIALASALAIARRSNRAILACCSVWLLLLGVRTFFQTLYWQDTRTLFEHELAVNPRSDIAYNNLANYYLFRGDSQTALGYARQLVEKFPRLADGYLVMGAILAGENRPEEAIEYLRKGLALDPHDLNGLTNLAGLLAQTGRTQEARQVTDTVLAYAPENGQAHLNLAIMLAQQGKIDQALPEFAAAARCNPEDVKAQTYLADTLVIKGRNAEAAEHYSAALRLDPNYEPARQGLSRLNGM